MSPSLRRQMIRGGFCEGARRALHHARAWPQSAMMTGLEVAPDPEPTARSS